MSQASDPAFVRCFVNDPKMSVWVGLAGEYLSYEKKPHKKNVLTQALRAFLRDLIVGQSQVREPCVFLSVEYKAASIESALGKGGVRWHREKRNKIYDFLLWILETRFSIQLSNGYSIVPQGYRLPFTRSNKDRDDSFLWLTAAYPHLEEWRLYAASYLGLQLRNRQYIKWMISQFLEHSIVGNDDRTIPSQFFSAPSGLPPIHDIFSSTERSTQLRFDLSLGDFLDWSMNQERANQNENRSDLTNPYAPPRKVGKRKLRCDGRTTDHEFKWVLQLDEGMETWRMLVAGYASIFLQKNPRCWQRFQKHIGWFLEGYIIGLDQPRNPLEFLHIDFNPVSVKGVFSHSPERLLYDFVKWTLKEGLGRIEELGRTVVRDELRNPFTIGSGTRVGNKSSNPSFSWLREFHPRLEQWRQLGENYIRTLRSGFQHSVYSLHRFFLHLILPNKSYWDPANFFRRENSLPPSTEWISGAEPWRASVIRVLSGFSAWVLANHLSVEESTGRNVVPYEFINPFDNEILSHRGPEFTETNKIPLPFRYIDECRRILNQGPSFREWTFAQRGLRGTHGGDWFEVPITAINESDPDCVWETREVNYYKQGGISLLGKRTAYFMWCPARSVALYLKLLLPLRTYQVRVLDSGESDTFRYDPNCEPHWALNSSRLASGTKKYPSQRGVFRRFATVDGDEMTGFYINTNKTSDLGRDASSRGYSIPWQYDEALQWLARLRDWQEKYNPVRAPTSWATLDRRHVALKSMTELSTLGESCFLFRDAAARGEDRMKPIRIGTVEPLWGSVCFELENRVFTQGARLPSGQRIPFVRLDGVKRRSYLSLFPLHSLRVSLLTLFALQGGVPLVYLSKLLAGHARLLMTIYYIKPGIVELTETMVDAMDRIGNNASEAEMRWLAEASQRDLEVKTAYNDKGAVEVLLDGRPGAGWLFDAKGVCPVGRARCDDGGPVLVGKHKGGRRNAPVSGGPGNCVQCRFFITGPAFLPGLVAHQNLLSYRFGDLGRRYQETDRRISTLKDNRDATITGDTSISPEEKRELARLEVEFERIQGQIDLVGRDVVATHRLIQRCLTILNQSVEVELESDQEDSTVALVASGSTEDVRASLEEVTELHQLAVLCENAVLYPESENDSAIFRRSQLIDAALETRRLEPQLCRLSREEQLRVGNHVMRFLSAHAGSLRNAVGILECTDRLRDLGLLTEAVRSAAEQSQLATPVSLALMPVVGQDRSASRN